MGKSFFFRLLTPDFWLLFLLLSFLALVLLHLPLLNLPYYWDEAGHFIPAARDIYTTFDFIPYSTLSNAHPPLFMAYLALAWKIFGYSFIVTRTACLLVAASALLAVFQIARRFATRSVAMATVICTALYPVFFAQSALAHLDMTAASLTLWGLLLYLPRPLDEASHAASPLCLKPDSVVRLIVATALFALAALAKETAILTPFALVAWSLGCQVFGAWRNRHARHESHTQASSFAHRVLVSLIPTLAALPLMLWFAYHYACTGYVFGNPEFFRYNVASTFDLARIFRVIAQRLWHVTMYMNLWALSIPALFAMTRWAIKDDGIARPRIHLGVQLIFLIVILAHVVALSIIGGAVLARYMLPIYPLVILIYVSTLRRRFRHWYMVIAVACLAFVIGWFVTIEPRYPYEENLTYRHYIQLHQRAARIVERDYPTVRILTAWTMTDELTTPFLGYVNRSFAVTKLESFSRADITRAIQSGESFDVAIVFPTNSHPDDLPAAQVANLINGRIVFYEERGNLWIAIIEKL